MRFKGVGISCALIISVISGSALADAVTALQWLNSRVQVDGSIATAGDIATAYQSTAETLRALRLNGQAGTGTTLQGLEYLESDTSVTTEYLARKIVAQADAGGSVSTSIAQLNARQDPITGGFGSDATYQPSAIDTSYALEALGASGIGITDATLKALNFLVAQQLSDGSWRDDANESSLQLTAMAVSALSYFANRPGIGNALQKGSTYLLAGRQENGLWEDDFSSALILIAIGQASIDRSSINSSLQALRTRQSQDGSWSTDTYVTALALRALTLSGGSIAVAPGEFTFSNLVTPVAGGSAGQAQVISFDLRNNANQTKDTAILAYVLDSSGKSIANLSPFASGAMTPQVNYTFGAQESLALQLSWNPNQNAPGIYQVLITAIRPNSITPDNPRGDIIEEARVSITVNATEQISGSVVFNPPLVQAGSQTPVSLRGLIVNSGNVDLPALPLTMSVKDDHQNVVFTTSASSPALQPGKFQYVDFGEWTPNVTGNLVALVEAGSVPGSARGALYIGNKASAQFTVNHPVVPTGTQTVRANVQVTGIDPTVAVSADPYYLPVKQAIQRGAAYVGPAAVQWGKTNNCMGCHIQTQSLIGLARSSESVPIDTSYQTYLVNEMAMSQSGNGAISRAHSGYQTQAPTALALWGLSEWQQPKSIARMQALAAQFIHSEIQTTGDQKYLPATDNTGGWWRNNIPAMNMMAVKGFTATLKNLDALGNQFLSYNVGDGLPAGVSYIQDIAYANGKLYSTGAFGAVAMIDVATGSVTGIGGMTRANAIAVGQDDVVYFTGENQLGNFAIARKRPGQNQEILVDGGEAYFTDLAISSSGAVYAVQPDTNKLFRVEPSGALVLIAQGGLLDRPASLAFASNGTLYIGNYGNHEILKMDPSGNILRASPGYKELAPRWMKVDPISGDLFIRDQQSAAVWSMASDGVVTLVARSSYYGVDAGAPAFSEDGQLYLANQNQPDIRKWNKSFQTIDAPLQEDIIGIVKYTLATYQDNAFGNLIPAWRLMTLGEARAYITDAQLLSQVDFAISAIATTLKQRQQADGGWAETYGVSASSDPLVTAAVGMAIEYTNPSVSDPVIRNSVAYLLQSQLPDYSWPSNNSFFTTHLASTSFVMAYLPRALDLLGTIDADLSIVTPPNVSLSNATQSPAEEVAAADGSITRRWSFTGLGADSHQIGFDLTLASLLNDEDRSVATEAYLGFKNTFTGEPMRLDLTIPKVHAASGLGMMLSTDQPSYAANVPVTIAAIVGNASTADSAKAHLFVRAAGEQEPITDLGIVDIGALDSGQSAVRNAWWNTGSYRVGQYEIYGTLSDGSGNLVDTAIAEFSIVADGSTAAASLSTDKSEYRGIDTVNIKARLRNLSSNAALGLSTGDLTVLSPSNAVIFTQSFNLNEMPAGSLHDESATLNLNRATAGEYAIHWVIKDRSTQNVVVQATGHFNVVHDAAQDIAGAVTVQTTSLTRGQSQLCTDTLNNTGAVNYSDLPVRQLVARLDQDTLINTQDQSIVLNAGATQTLTRNFATGTLVPGDYSCILQVNPSGDWVTLAHAVFRVVSEPLQVTETIDTDKPSYTTTDQAVISVRVRNLARYRTEPGTTLQILITSPSGTNVRTQSIPLGDLAAGADLTPSDTYSFVDAAEGIYEIKSYVLGSAGEILASADTTFVMRKSLAAAITGTVTAQYPVREQGDSQTCTDTLNNSSLSAVSGLDIRQILARTDQTQIITTTPSTINLAAHGTQSLIRVFDTAPLAAGQYACRLDARINDQWKTLASAAFEVKPVPVRVDASLGIGTKGRLLVLMDSASKPEPSSGPCEQRNLGVRLEAEFDPPLSPSAVVTVKLLGLLGSVIDVESIALLAFDGEINNHVSTTPIDLSIPYVSADGVTIQLTGKNVPQLLGDQYGVLITVVDATRTLSLSTGTIDLGCGAYNGFWTLFHNAIKVVGLGPKNVIGITDAPGDGADSRTAAQQKAYLESLLQQNRWSYKIVTDTDSFTREMRSGGYNTYALLSEYIVLSEQAEKELREAVHRGDGLFVAGRHDTRNHILDDALGVKYKGTHDQATGVRLLQTPVFNAATATFTQTDTFIQRVRQLSGTKLGQVIRAGTTPNDALVTGNAYRNGKSVMVGFDALAEASASTATPSVFADILSKSLDYVHPASITPLGGRVVPIRLSLDNRALATTPTVVISTTPSPGSYIVATSAGTLAAGKVTWNPALGVNESKTLDLWVSLPSGGIPVEISANLKATVNGTLTDLGTTKYTVNPLSKPSLDDAITHLQAYVSTLPQNALGQLLDPIFGTRPPAKKALERLMAARQALVSGNPQSALLELVTASDELMRDTNTQIPPIRLEVDQAILEAGQLQ